MAIDFLLRVRLQPGLRLATRVRAWARAVGDAVPVPATASGAHPCGLARIASALLVFGLGNVVGAVALMLLIGVTGGSRGLLGFLVPPAPALCLAFSAWAAWRRDRQLCRRALNPPAAAARP